MELHNYARHLNKSFLGEVRNSKRELKKLEKEINSFTRKLQLAHSKIHEQQQRHKILTTLTSLEKAQTHYLTMKKMIERGIYKKINFRNGTCVAETGKCYISHRLKRYFVGRFKIRITKSSVRYFNLDYPQYPVHPHISSSGDPCYGNIGLALAKMLGRKEYPIALELIYKYLNSYNNRDAYISVDNEKWHWKKVKEKQNEKNVTAKVI